MLPAIDLHLHFDGSLSIDNVKKLAILEHIALPEDSELSRMMCVSADCKNLGEYLQKFAFPLSLLQSSEAISFAMYTLCEELLAEGTVYAEIRFAPQLHTQKGLTQHEVLTAALDGFFKSSLMGGLILCCMRREDNFKENLLTARIAKHFLGKGVLALDLAGNEAVYPNGRFSEVFEYARDCEIPFTIHAGEADGADSVMSAIELGARRIGHGVRSYERQDVLDWLAKNKIALEICPTSNLNTCVFNSLEDFPIRRFIKEGIAFTINSDNRTVSQTNAANELELICNSFGFTQHEKKQLLLNSADAAFCDEDTRIKIKKQIENYFNKI